MEINEMIQAMVNHGAAIVMDDEGNGSAGPFSFSGCDLIGHLESGLFDNSTFEDLDDERMKVAFDCFNMDSEEDGATDPANLDDGNAYVTDEYDQVA